MTQHEPLAIAFFGSSLTSSYWNGAATYYRGLIRALYALGHRVTFYEPDILDRQAHRDLGEIDWASVVVYPAQSERDVYDALARADVADVVIKASGVGAHDELLEREVARLATPDSIAAFWDVDAPATLDRLEGDPADPFHEHVSRYDAIFTYGGGPEVVARYTALGAQQCIPIYNALDPDVHHPVEADPRFACDLALLANRLPDREARVREFLLEPACRMANSSFVLGGSGWEAHQLSANVRHVGHVYIHEHNAFNVTPRAVLNVNRESMARVGYSPATRVFEAAGAGACIITDGWPGIDAFFTPGEELLVASSGREVESLVRGLDRTTSARIGAAARRRALASHTYTHRAAEVVRQIAQLRSGAEAVR